MKVISSNSDSMGMACFPKTGLVAHKRVAPTSRQFRTPGIKRFFMRFLVVVLIAGLGASCTRLNTRVENGIESGGSKYTGVPVGVGQVDLKILRGSGQITGLTVANPDGYVAENAFRMDLMRLDIGVLSLLMWFRPVILDELIIDAPVVNLELNEQGGSNLRDISDNVAKNMEPADDKLKEPETKTDKPPDESRRIVIRKLVIDGVSYSVLLKDGSSQSGTLPAIELTDVGGSDGKTPAELSTVVVVAMAREMLKEALARKLFETVGELKSEGLPEEWKAYNVDKLVVSLEEKLNLSGDQKTKLHAVVETTVQELNDAIEERRVDGLLDLEALSHQFKTASEATQEQLEDVLDSEQMEELREFLAEIDAEAIQKIKNVLVEKLSSYLGLSPEQVDGFRKVFWEEVEKRNELLSRFTKEHDVSFKDFLSDLETLQKETLRKLEGTLDAKQIDFLSERQDELRETIRSVFSSDG
jgi:hypothetical protein